MRSGAGHQVESDLFRDECLRWARIAMAEIRSCGQIQNFVCGVAVVTGCCSLLQHLTERKTKSNAATRSKAQRSSKLATFFAPPPIHKLRVFGSVRWFWCSARDAKAARDLCGAARRSSRCSCMSQSLLAAPFAESLHEAEEFLKINFFNLAAHYSSCSSACTWLVCIGTP